MTAIPKLRFPFGLAPTGAPRPNLFVPEAWSGEISDYRTSPGATLTPAGAEGTKVVTPGSSTLEGVNSGNIIAVKAGVTYRVVVSVKGNAGGEILRLLVGDGTIGFASQGFIATTERQLVEAAYTPTVSGFTGLAVTTHEVKAADTFWVDDTQFLGPVPVGLATVEQDSIEEIKQNVLVALSTRIGSRVDAPEYGTPSELFAQLTPEPSVDAVLAAVEEWEPRASLLSEIEVEELVERVQVRAGATGL